MYIHFFSQYWLIMAIEQCLPFHNLSDVELENVIKVKTHKFTLNVIDNLIYTHSDRDRPDHTIANLSEPSLPEPTCDYVFLQCGSEQYIFY